MARAHRVHARARVRGGMVVGLLMALVATASPSPADARTSAIGSCAGFRSWTGVTSTAITIANVSDLTGPVPGAGKPALLAVKAFARYFNTTSSICGHKLKVLALDSQMSTAGNASGYATACSDAFAAVGSLSAFDSGGAGTAQNCRLPDLRSQSITATRNACTTCFGVQATQAKAFPNAIPDYFLTNHHTATQAAALLYANFGGYPARATTAIAAEQARGFQFAYTAAVDLADFNYGPYVQQLISKGVKLVQFVGPVQQAIRLAQAMHDAAYTPIYQPDASSYVPPFAQTSAAAGAYVALSTVPFEQQASNAELHRYVTWLQKVALGSKPTIDGLYAWSAARLFVDRAKALGGRLSRSNLVSAVHEVKHWSDLGAHASQNVGSKVIGTCFRFLKLSGGHWNPVGGTSYSCSGKTVVP